MLLPVNKIRKDFPIFQKRKKPFVYLDNAATTQKPKIVIQKTKDFYEKYNANIHRGIYSLAEEATQLYEEVREKVAHFIKARFKEEIIFTKNATEAINLVAFSWGEKFVKKGDKILLTQMEHHANILPWQRLAKRKKAKLEFVKITKKGKLDLKDLRKKLTSKTKILALAHVSNVLGTINPVSKITKWAHQKKAIVLVDGAQSVPHLKINVQNLGCDFLVFSGHKMLASTGVGVLYGRKEILEKMPPFLLGGEMIKEVTFKKVIFNDLPYKFEAGTPPIAQVVGLGAAIDYLEKIGLENIEKHERHLTRYALRALNKLPQIKIYGPLSYKERVGVISFTLFPIHHHDIASILDNKGICIRAGYHCAQPLHCVFNISGTVRASFYFYNSLEDTDKLVEALKEVIYIFRK